MTARFELGEVFRELDFCSIVLNIAVSGVPVVGYIGDFLPLESSNVGAFGATLPPGSGLPA